jgi:hypothetical protein
MAELRNAYRILVERENLEDPGIDGNMILKWLLKIGQEGVGWICSV